MAGILKEQDKRREVVGIELDPMFAARSLNKFDYLLVGNIENMELKFPTGYFDCIILNNVLEKLLTPRDTLLHMKKFIRSGGCLVLNVSNVRNINIINQLVTKGSWLYRPEQIRFFSAGDIKRMLVSVNMTPETIDYIKDSHIPEPVPENKILPQNLTADDINELQAKGFVIRAMPCIPLSPSKELTSIIVVSCQPGPAGCLESIQRCTPEDHEIIIIDNGSGNDTIKTLAGKKNTRVFRVDSSDFNYAAACNLGISVARGRYICLLRPEATVFPGWLTHLIYHLENNPDVLAVGPADEQVEGINTLSGLESFAHTRRISNWQKASETDSLGEGCILLKNKVKEIIGVLNAGLPAVQDAVSDYCRRIKRAGYKLLLADDVYIHKGRY